MGNIIRCMNAMHVFPVGTELGGKVYGAGKTGEVAGDKSDFALGSQASMEFKRSIKVPLTEREVFSITKTWKLINSNITHTGVAMFLRMFENREDVKAMFEQFRSVDKQDLGSSRALENHALLVMNALDEAIANLDEPDYLIDMLLLTGKSHRRFEDFSADIFWAIEEPFTVAVKEALGERFTPQMEKIYSRTIKFILSLLTMGFDNARYLTASKPDLKDTNFEEDSDDD